MVEEQDDVVLSTVKLDSGGSIYAKKFGNEIYIYLSDETIIKRSYPTLIARVKTETDADVWLKWYSEVCNRGVYLLDDDLPLEAPLKDINVKLKISLLMIVDIMTKGGYRVSVTQGNGCEIIIKTGNGQVTYSMIDDEVTSVSQYTYRLIKRFIRKGA